MLISSDLSIAKEARRFIREHKDILLYTRNKATKEFFTVYRFSNLYNISYTKVFDCNDFGILFKGTICPYINKDKSSVACFSFSSTYQIILPYNDYTNNKSDDYTKKEAEINDNIAKFMNIGFLFTPYDATVANQNHQNVYEYLVDKYKNKAKLVADNLVKITYKCNCDIGFLNKCITYNTSEMEMINHKPEDVILRNINYIFTINADSDNRSAEVLVNLAFFETTEPLVFSIDYSSDMINSLCMDPLVSNNIEDTTDKEEIKKEEEFEKMNPISKLLFKFQKWILGNTCI